MRLKDVGVRHPVMQVGMPGIARAELAAAVARAGGIGTVGLTDQSIWEQTLRAAIDLAKGHPLCAHLLLPFARQSHVDVILDLEIPMVSLFWTEQSGGRLDGTGHSTTKGQQSVRKRSGISGLRQNLERRTGGRPEPE